MADPTIVLVHGAFADASGFRGLYDELLGQDMTVVAPPNPLRGLTGGDGEYLKAVIDEIGGPVLLAGHSYGGSVITAAGTAGNVVGLVYISGFAPDEGENLTDLQSKFPAPGAMPYFREHPLPGGGKELTLAPEGFHESFCADIPADDAAFYAISQRPLAGEVLVAEQNGELVAALGADRAIADPFRPTADLVALLRVRSGGVAATTQRRGIARIPHLRTA